MKYVIYKQIEEDTGSIIYFPFIIPEHVSHDEFTPNKESSRPKIILHSAGFFHFENGKIIIENKPSISLNASPKLIDEKIISNLFLNYGQYGFITY